MLELHETFMYLKVFDPQKYNQKYKTLNFDADWIFIWRPKTALEWRINF